MGPVGVIFGPNMWSVFLVLGPSGANWGHLKFSGIIWGALGPVNFAMISSHLLPATSHHHSAKLPAHHPAAHNFADPSGDILRVKLVSAFVAAVRVRAAQNLSRISCVIVVGGWWVGAIILPMVCFWYMDHLGASIFLKMYSLARPIKGGPSFGSLIEPAGWTNMGPLVLRVAFWSRKWSLFFGRIGCL